MALLITTVSAAVVWIVLLSLGVKPFDALLVGVLMVFLAAAAKHFAPFLPGSRREEKPGDRYIPR
jgi:hypothetical protein